MSPKFSQKILISTNSSCNLKCIYCFEKNKSNYEFDVQEAASLIGEMLSKRTEFGTKIKIHGGEPFLVFDKFKQLFESIESRDYPEYYEFHITTNGTLIHGEIQDWLLEKKNRIRLKLSIDGDKKSNEINRPNSFDKINFPFLVKTWPDIVASMTITPQTLSYFYDNILFLHNQGFNNIIFQLSLLTDWKNPEYLREYNKQLSLLVEYYLNNPLISPCFKWLNIEKALDDPMPMCGVGRMKAYDFQSRDYYPCQMCFPSACGNKLSSALQKVNFLSPDILSSGICSTCPFVNLCVTCYAENYISRGAASNRDMNICKYQQVLIANVFKYEYSRLLSIGNPIDCDVRKMLAIQKCLNDVNKVLLDINSF